MNTEALRAFYLTVVNKSISQTAKELHITQPALSMQLQALEKSIGATLLHRSNQGVTPTRHGEVVYDYAKHIIRIMDNLHQSLEELDQKTYRQLAIGACPSIAEYSLPCSIYLFKEKFPEAQINQKVLDSETIIEEVANRSIDVGLIQGYYRRDDIVIKKLYTSKVYLIMPSSHSYVSGQSLTWGKLKECPLVFPEKESCARNMIDHILKEHRIGTNDLQVTMEFNSLEAIKSLVLSGRGMAFLPYIMIKKELYTGKLIPVEIEGANLHWEYSIAYANEQALRSINGDFLRFITSTKRGFC